MHSTLIFSAIAFSLFLSCGRAGNGSIANANGPHQDTISADSLPPPEDYISGRNYPEDFVSVHPALLPADKIIPFKGKILKSEITKYQFIPDTLFLIRTDSSLEVSYHDIYGYTQAPFYIYNRMYADHEGPELLSYVFAKDTIIIPFRFDMDGELTLLTRWKKGYADTLEYVDYFKTVIGTKYARVEILEARKWDGYPYMAYKINGGEGGEYWEDLCLARIQGDNRLNTHTLYSVGGNGDADTLSSIQYEMTRDGIKWYNLRSVKEDNHGTWSYRLLPREYVSTFKFKDLQ